MYVLRKTNTGVIGGVLLEERDSKSSYIKYLVIKVIVDTDYHNTKGKSLNIIKEGEVSYYTTYKDFLDAIRLELML